MKGMEEVRAIAEKGTYKVLPVSCELLSDLCTPIQALKKLKNVSSHCYILESVDGREKWGRYTFLGYDPKLEVTCLDGEMKVVRNDHLTLDEIRALNPDRVILSPGPGRPEDAGVTMEAARELGKVCPVLGVCLGHQAICAAFGATITYAKQLMHGKQSVAALDEDCPLFRDCPAETKVARYHSLAAVPATLPDVLKVTARTADGEVMAVEHRDLPVYGVQFHPESILTPEGRTMLKNFLDLRKEGTM